MPMAVCLTPQTSTVRVLVVEPGEPACACVVLTTMVRGYTQSTILCSSPRLCFTGTAACGSWRGCALGLPWLYVGQVSHAWW